MAETFRACLGLVYTCYTERLAGPGGEPVRLETLVRNILMVTAGEHCYQVGNLLGICPVPSPSSPPLKFSLGAGDRQVA